MIEIEVMPVEQLGPSTYAGQGSDERSLINWTQAIYGLHAFSLLTGILGAATVVGAFLTG
jgi:hypothetical protein